MTHDKWTKLTPEQQLVKMAECDGWVSNGAGYWHKNGEVRALYYESYDGEGRAEDIHKLPDYLYDLNEMHEVEKQIPLAYLEKYWDNLKKICTNPRFLEIGVIASNAISATAAQRAEAFVLTMEPE